MCWHVLLQKHASAHAARTVTIRHYTRRLLYLTCFTSTKVQILTRTASSGPRPQARELASKAQTIESLRDALAAGEERLVELRRDLAEDAEAASSRDEAAAQRGEALAAALERAEGEAKQARERAAAAELSSSRARRELETQLEVFFLFFICFLSFRVALQTCVFVLLSFPKKKLALTYGSHRRRAARSRACRANSRRTRTTRRDCHKR